MLFSYKFFTRQFNPRQQTPAIKSHNHQNTTTTTKIKITQKSKSHRERDWWVEDRWVEGEITRRRDRRCDRRSVIVGLELARSIGACDRRELELGGLFFLSLSLSVRNSFEMKIGTEIHFRGQKRIFFGQLKLISGK